MPCYRCGQRQDDPVKGASPWRRGVRAHEQVLVCPLCQQQHDWTADLDRCSSCGSTALVRRLGETVCRACGEVSRTEPPAQSTPRRTPGADAASGLADEVAAALRRVLGTH